MSSNAGAYDSGLVTVSQNTGFLMGLWLGGYLTTGALLDLRFFLSTSCELPVTHTSRETLPPTLLIFLQVSSILSSRTFINHTNGASRPNKNTS